MNCLECTTIAQEAPASTVNQAVALCVDCGAGVCLTHAEFAAVVQRPIGVVPRFAVGARRIRCRVCAAAPGTGHDGVADGTRPLVVEGGV